MQAVRRSHCFWVLYFCFCSGDPPPTAGRQERAWLLTLFAVLPGPARQTGQAAIWLAHVVAEVVIALLAQAGAAVPIVVVTADDPVRVAKPCWERVSLFIQ